MYINKYVVWIAAVILVATTVAAVLSYTEWQSLHSQQQCIDEALFTNVGMSHYDRLDTIAKCGLLR